VSPKLFSKDAIIANLLKAKKGERNLEATSMAGALRLGTDAYFLPRWIDKKGYTWLEVLVKVDLSSKRPKPILLGRFPGMSLASGSLDSRLFPLQEQPAIIIRKEGEWGVCAFDPVSNEFSYTTIGERLRAYSQLSGNDIAFIEAEDGGLSMVGVANLVTASRTDALEDRGNIRVLDSYRPVCALVSTQDRFTIRNLQTSAAMDLMVGAGVERTALGVLVWWPKEQPKHAALLDPERWDRLAVWNAPIETAPETKQPSAKPQTRLPASGSAATKSQRPTGLRRGQSRIQPRP
jgi:hypothetical protein